MIKKINQDTEQFSDEEGIENYTFSNPEIGKFIKQTLVGIDGIGKTLEDNIRKELKKSDERMQKSIENENSSDNYEGIKRLFQQNDSTHYEEREGEENVRFLFDDGRMFNILNKLHKYELLQIFKKQFKLSKEDTKIIDKIVAQNTLNEKEQDYLSDFTKNLKGNEFDVLEKIIEGHAKHIEIQEENEQQKNDMFNTLKKLCQFDLLDIIGSSKLEKSENLS